MLRLGRTCKVLLLVCAGAFAAHTARATEFVFPSTTSQPQNPDWAGFYLQSHGSGAAGIPWTTPGNANAFTSPGAAPAVSESFGYNFQSGNFVFGLEGSLSAANIDGKFTAPYLPPDGAWTPNMSWVGTVTGRIGYLFGRWLPYVKGGFVAADVGAPAGGAAFTQASTELGGWTAGVGLQYQLSSKWSLGLEYLYTDLGNGAAGGPQNSVAGAPIAGSPDVYGTALKTQSFLGRINYKAGW